MRFLPGVIVVITVVTALLAAVPGTALAATPGQAPGHRPPGTDGDLRALVDRVVTAQLAGHRIPGAAVTVVADGRTVLGAGYGVADIERHTPVDAATTGSFPASVTKLFTATAASQLIAQGRIDPDADVNDYLRAFQIHDTFPDRPVTMHHLLTHTAGFDKNFVGLNSATGTAVAPLGATLAELQPARVRPPGTVVAYDNYGFALAGYLVEVVSGMPFEQYVRRHVLDPLGMSATTLRQTHPPRIAATLATGYRPDGDGYTAARGQYGPWTPTGGGVVSTAADMARFMAAQLSGDPRLGAGVTEVMQRRHFAQDERVPGMAYGFAEDLRNGQRLLRKDGDLPGFHSNLVLLPAHDLGIFVVYNGDGTDDAAYRDAKHLARRIVDHYVPPGAAPGPPPAGPAAAGDPDRYTGTYRASTTSRDSLMKVAALTAPVTVETDGIGGLVTSGLALDPAREPQHWIPRGPGLFTSADGQERIAFDDGLLAGTGPEATAYRRLAWYQDPTLHQYALGFGLAGLLVAFVWFPIAALVRRRRRHPRATRGVRIARAAGWISGALAVAFTGGFVYLTADGNRMAEAGLLGTPLLTVLPFVPAAMILTCAAVVVVTPIAWRRRWWAPTGLLGYTLLALASIAFLAVAVDYNLAALGDFRGS